MSTEPSKVPLSLDDLKEHVREHIGFLKRSGEAFDSGNVDEAKRLAVSIRVLCHDTKQSHSLLGQLSLKDNRFLSSAHPYNERNLLTHMGLLMMRLGPGGPSMWPPLDDNHTFRKMPFEEWWNEIVIVDNTKRKLSRRQLVLVAANRDGGAHVDPNLDEVYHALAKQNSLGWYSDDGDSVTPLDGAEKASIRQIAHELIRILDPGYSRSQVALGKHPLILESKQGRDERCACGSGRKFKKCHGIGQ